MYLSKNIILGQLVFKKVWLYKDGNEFVENTGGWIASGAGAIKNEDTMMLTTPNGIEKTFKTANNISIKNGERLYITYVNTGLPNNTTYRLAAYKDVPTGPSLGAFSLNPNFKDVARTRFINFSSTSEFKLVLQAVYSTWIISEIWIEKYESFNDI